MSPESRSFANAVFKALDIEMSDDALACMERYAAKIAAYQASRV